MKKKKINNKTRVICLIKGKISSCSVLIRNYTFLHNNGMIPCGNACWLETPQLAA